MEVYEHVMNVMVGMLIIPVVTEALKNWFRVDCPLLKLVIVLLLSGVVGIGMAKMYVPEMSIETAAAAGLTIALSAITGKVIHKTHKEKKERP